MTIWTEKVRGQGYRVASGSHPVYQAGEIDLLTGEEVRETIVVRYVGRPYDFRNFSPHVASDSPCGSVRQQIVDCLRRHLITCVEFTHPDAPHAG